MYIIRCCFPQEVFPVCKLCLPLCSTLNEQNFQKTGKALKSKLFSVNLLTQLHCFNKEKRKSLVWLLQVSYLLRKMRGRRSDDDGQLTLSNVNAGSDSLLLDDEIYRPTTLLLCLLKLSYFAIARRIRSGGPLYSSFIFVISKDDVDGLFSEKCNLVYCPLWQLVVGDLLPVSF